MLITVLKGTNLFLVIQERAEKTNTVFTRELLFRKMQLICLVLPEGGSWKMIKFVFCLFVQRLQVCYHWVEFIFLF